MKINVHIGKTPTSKEPRAAKNHIGLIHKVYLAKLKDSRQYTASTKTKSEVRGGGRKPWKQKGTGRARAGSSRSPLWVGGGVCFGPKPRIVERKINTKEKHAALSVALRLKKPDFRSFDESLFQKKQIKTHEINFFLKNAQSSCSRMNSKNSTKVLILTAEPNYSLWLAARALKNVELAQTTSVSIRQLLEAQYVFLGDKTSSTFFPNSSHEVCVL